MCALLLLAGSALGLLQVVKGWPFHTKVALPAKDIRPAGADVYAVSAPLRRALERPLHPRVHLLENGTPLILRLENSQAVRHSAAPAFALGTRQLWFRATDRSDPRENGRNYTVVFPKTLPAWLPTLCTVLLIAIPLLWLLLEFLPYLRHRLTRDAGSRLLIEQSLVALIVALIFLPGLLTLVFHIAGQALPTLAWLRNATLSGMSVVEEPIPLTPSTLASGAWQKKAAADFDAAFAGREAFIRLTAETWYRAFRRPALRSSGTVFGSGDVLHQYDYLTEYHLTRTTPGALAPFVRDLRRLQDICDSRQIALVFLITPSKASIESASIPPEWQARHDPRPRAYAQLLPLLAQHGVRVVDGHALTASFAPQATVPVFPKGGIHWSAEPALASTNAVLTSFATQGKPVVPLKVLRTVLTDIPTGEEGDLMDLMNLALPWRFPVIHLAVGPQGQQPPSPLLNLSIIGGSFTGKLINQLHASGQFREINHWFYYRLHKLTCSINGVSKVRSPVPSIDLNREIFAADCLILEVNEQAIGTTGPNHLTTFLREALAHVDAGHLKQTPYLREAALDCAWDEKISFGIGSRMHDRPHPCQRGFTPATPHMAIMTGRQAAIELSLPSAGQAVDVHFEASLQLPTNPVDADSKPVRLNISVNGQSVGTWESTSPSAVDTSRIVHIPADLLQGRPVCVLTFTVAGDPAENPTLRFHTLRCTPSAAATSRE